MTSVQRFLPNVRNRVRDAVLTASSVQASTALRTLSVDRQGNGRVRLVGPYTGHEAATFDVEIAAGGTTLRASTPVFSGVGNGTLAVTGIAAPAVAETWTLTLVDLGTDTTHAQLQVDSIALRAVAAGAAGNLVRLTVTPDLTPTATDYSLLADWPAGTETLAGPEFDFGGLPLSAKGEMDATSARLRMGTDYTIYRPYRAYTDGAWRYGLTPAPARAIPAGTRVYAVTGGYNVVVTDGTTTETYAAVETFYDLCQALAASALVEVVGVVTADRTPGGMAMRDVPLRTSSWVLSATGVALSGLAPAVDAPTETITVACINADAVGSEVWEVTGTVSGALGQAISGDAFTSAAVAFTVPDKSAEVTGTGAFTTRFNATTRVEGDAGIPSVGVVDFTLGINARPVTVKFTYEERPNDAGCDFNDAAITGHISAACLGLEGGVSTMDAALKSRLTDVYEWRHDFFDANIEGNAFAAKADMDYADQVVLEITSALKETYTDSAALAEWDAAWTEVQSDFTALAATPAYEFFVPVYKTSADWLALGLPNYSGYAMWVNRVLVNRINGHMYRVTAVSGGQATGDVAIVSAIQFDQTSASVWKTDGTSSTMGGTTTCTVLDLGVASDLYQAWLSTTLGAEDGVHEDGSVSVSALIGQLVRRYAARMDLVRITAGIDPKSSASGMAAGDGCWRDVPEASHWWVDDSGTYFPAFTNVAYISSRQSCGSGASAGIPLGQSYTTREFGFAIAVGCEDRLKVGDSVTITIESTDGDKPYSVGATAEIQIVTAGPAYLAGGVDGDDTHVWSVLGSVSGAHADYEVPSDSSAVPAYTDDGVSMQFAFGGIPQALGDRWVYDIEAGQFRWRKGVGSWSSLTDIDDEVTLSDGVSAQFIAGAAPSFVGDDAYQFGAEQPAAPSHCQIPSAAQWQWDGATATLTIALGATETITALALARYTLPAGATLDIEGGDGSTWPESQSMDLSGPVSVAILAAPWAVSHLRLTVSDAAGGALGWLWAGEPLATTWSADTCRLVRQWATVRGAGLNPARQHLGRGTGGEIAWDADGNQTLLTDADRVALLAMLDDLQTGAEPMILVPHHLHPEDAALVDVQFDQVDMRDVHEWRPDDTQHRMISMSIPLAAVLE